MGEFVAVLWECWNARNRFIFKTLDENLSMLSTRAISFVRNYRTMRAREGIQHEPLPAIWKPPVSGILKLNFDGGKIGEHDWGWGFVIHNQDGDIVLAGSKQGVGFAGP